MSSVPVKLDENLGQSHAELVRQAGHSADRVTDEGLSGALDPAVWQRVVTESPRSSSASFATIHSRPCGVALSSPIQAIRASAVHLLPIRHPEMKPNAWITFTTKR